MKYLKKFNLFEHSEIKGHINGGEADGKIIYDIVKKHGVTYDEIVKQLEVGKLVQMEHSKKLPENPKGDDSINKEISLDHLTENPIYYTELIEAGIVDELDALKKYIELFGEINSEEARNKYKEKFGEF